MPYTTGRFTVDQLEFIATVPVSLLAAVAAGDFDMNRLAREELAQRGYDQCGVWVGFARAKASLLGWASEESRHSPRDALIESAGDANHKGT